MKTYQIWIEIQQMSQLDYLIYYWPPVMILLVAEIDSIKWRQSTSIIFYADKFMLAVSTCMCTNERERETENL